MTREGWVRRVLDVARQEIGVHEEGGNNRGERVEEYLARVRWHAGDPWCAAFVGWCGSEALGEDWPLPLVPGTWTLLNHAARYGWIVDTPERGNLFLVWSGERRSWHTGFIQSFVPGGWLTVEGNVAGGTPGKGDGVREKVRRFNAHDTFIDWTRGVDITLTNGGDK